MLYACSNSGGPGQQQAKGQGLERPRQGGRWGEAVLGRRGEAQAQCCRHGNVHSRPSELTVSTGQRCIGAEGSRLEAGWKQAGLEGCLVWGSGTWC